jgi:3-isopropylmalate dehydratase small subunit
VVAASAVAGVVALPHDLPAEPVLFTRGSGGEEAVPEEAAPAPAPAQAKPEVLKGRVWVVEKDNIDTDMIFHNRYLTITDIAEMGQYTFDNLEGWEDFAKQAQPGDIVVTGKNFGAGSSRQQAVDCFKSLGVRAIVAESFGAIYERNAINQGFPIVAADIIAAGLEDGDEIEVDLANQTIRLPSGDEVPAAFSDVQMAIYQRGGVFGPGA